MASIELSRRVEKVVGHPPLVELSDGIKVNPTTGLKIPRGEKPRDRIADPAEAAALLAALPEGDRALWGSAMYAGLRRGELRALTVADIDLEANVIRVEWGWDDMQGRIATKAGKGRTVPIPTLLRELLVAHLMRTGRRANPGALVFGATATEPFAHRDVTRQADAARSAAGLARIQLHECRHTFASYMIAASVNAKAPASFLSGRARNGAQGRMYYI